MLSVKNIDVAYGHARVLHDISLELEAGSMVFMAGRNGAGKTTFLKSIAGFMKPIAGSISFLGRDISGMAPEKVALMGIRYVFQDKRVFSNLTVRENLELAAYPVKEKTSHAIEKVMSIYPKMDKFLNLRAELERRPAAGLATAGRSSAIRSCCLSTSSRRLRAGTINDIPNVLAVMKGKVLSRSSSSRTLSVVGMLAEKVYRGEGKIVQHMHVQRGDSGQGAAGAVPVSQARAARRRYREKRP